jgi:hypothetical protein
VYRKDKEDFEILAIVKYEDGYFEQQINIYICPKDEDFEILSIVKHLDDHLKLHMYM